jgi:tyrosinase
MITRKNAFNISATEQTDYVDGVKALIASGEYVDLVNKHLDMKYRMHTMDSTGLIGTRRFLPWHRDYLLKMETKLRARKPNAFVPYWDWTQPGVPAFIVAFKPSLNGLVDHTGTGVPSHMDNNRTVPGGAVSNAGEIQTILNAADYDEMTQRLEGGPHNRGHRMLGSPMTTFGSPTDPIFWMHHAMVDRVWSQWQASHAGKGPLLTGDDAKMDPWGETVSALDSISTLGYGYA